MNKPAPPTRTGLHRLDEVSKPPRWVYEGEYESVEQWCQMRTRPGVEYRIDYALVNGQVMVIGRNAETGSWGMRFWMVKRLRSKTS